MAGLHARNRVVSPALGCPTRSHTAVTAPRRNGPAPAIFRCTPRKTKCKSSWLNSSRSTRMTGSLTCTPRQTRRRSIFHFEERKWRRLSEELVRHCQLWRFPASPPLPTLLLSLSLSYTHRGELAPAHLVLRTLLWPSLAASNSPHVWWFGTAQQPPCAESKLSGFLFRRSFNYFIVAPDELAVHTDNKLELSSVKQKQAVREEHGIRASAPRLDKPCVALILAVAMCIVRSLD